MGHPLVLERDTFENPSPGHPAEIVPTERNASAILAMPLTITLRSIGLYCSPRRSRKDAQEPALSEVEGMGHPLVFKQDRFKNPSPGPPARCNLLT
jgi:hypothetical protein